MRRGRGLARWGIAILLLASGCSSAPLADRYFDRQDPFDTLQGFAYAVEAKQYRFAYDCLTPESRQRLSFTRFRLGLRFNVEVPGVGVPIRNLIVDSERKRTRWQPLPGDRIGFLVNVNLSPKVEMEVPIVLRQETPAEAAAAGREKPIWLIDLDETGARLPRPQDPAAN